MQSKKQLILLVLNELNANSDKDNPLTQTQIAENLSGEKFKCDRKTVCRNIKFLKDMGYPIVKTTRGFYLDKVFSIDEIDFVKKAILSYGENTKRERERLAKKIGEVLAKQYRR